MRPWALFLILLCVSSFLFFFRLGERPLRNPDEGRYTNIAKEMVQRGDWVEPQLYGVDYLKKPILFYWLLALSFKCFGFTEWAARFVPALFGVLGVLATFLFAKKLFDAKTAFWAGLILTTNVWYLQIGRYVVIDMVFTFFVMAALYAFYMATLETRHSRLYALLFYACVAFSFLAKGFIGLIIPFITIASYALFTRQVKRILKKMRWVSGLVVFGVVAGPWLVAIGIREPEFLPFFFFHENVKRFISSSFEHQQPWYFYYAFLLAVFVPWILFFTPLKRSLKFSDTATKQRNVFLWVSATALVVFFSMSKGKLATYILPSAPFLSIAIARGWALWESEGMNERAKGWTAAPLLALSLVSVFLLIAMPLYIKTRANDFLQATFVSFQWLAVIVAAGSILGSFWVLKRNISGVFYTLILMFMIASFPVQAAMNSANNNYSTKHFAEALNPLIGDKDSVMIYGNPNALYDFGFYLKRPVQMVGLEGELEWLDQDEDIHERHLSKEKFYKMLAGRQHLYFLTRKIESENIPPDLIKNLTVIKEDKRKILYYLNVPA